MTLNGNPLQSNGLHSRLACTRSPVRIQLKPSFLFIFSLQICRFPPFFMLLFTLLSNSKGSPVEAVFTFSCFTANLQIFTLFYVLVIYFTIEFQRKKKKEGSKYGQIFSKIVHQKIIIVFEIHHSFCLILNAIQTNIKESKAFKRINLRLR